MADSPHDTGAADRSGAGLDHGSVHAPPAVPRWVKVTAVIVGVLILLVVIMRLTGLAGDHGPGRHMGADGAARAAITEFHNLLTLLVG